MPATTLEELEEISLDFEAVGLPGFTGSMDVVHFGWDKCPAELTSIFEGRSSYTTLAFEVTHRRKVLHVSITKLL
jgi:hypothetical protein